MPAAESLALVQNFLPAAREITREAGALAHGYFRSGGQTAAKVSYKTGGSPVTEADMAVDAFLKERLGRLLPEAAWLSEETADDPVRLAQKLVWIVDPIDGTRAFVSGSRDWCVALALLADGRPIFGHVFAPAWDHFYEAVLGGGATRNGAPIAVSDAAALGGSRVAGNKPLTDIFAKRAGTVERLPRIPSLALRIARVADGSVDVGLVSANSHDWDLAAADLILHEAGGRLTDYAGEAPRYNREKPTHGELVACPARLHQHVIEAMTA
jgi:myo-inositol-1(or 4)-monophosphatase